MKNAARKITRFYVINPIQDRRSEPRFESHESVVIRRDETGKTDPAVAFDVGRRGMKLETQVELLAGSSIQIVFPNTPDHARCFGRVIWCRLKEKSMEFECGILVEAWHGVVAGAESWQKFRGTRVKFDRRQKIR